MPKQITNNIKNRMKWVKENLDFKYIEPNAASIALEKKKVEERDAQMKKKDEL
jgi:hypothetical protein